MEFPLSPHVEAILKGRLRISKDGGHIQCCATKCLFETEKKGFGRDIEIKGKVVCPSCKAIVEYPQDLEFDEETRQANLKCSICKKISSLRNITWTQNVVSKHHRKKHLYYHKECYQAMFY
jgi:hypothetical protein